MIKRKFMIYIVSLSLFSWVMFLQNISIQELKAFKFSIPSKTLYVLILIFIIYLENMCMLEEIRNHIIMKENIIIRTKRRRYEKIIIKVLIQTLINYFIITVIWCFIILQSIPLHLLCIDLLIKVILLLMILKLYVKDNIYIILLLVNLFCRILVKFLILKV